MAIRQYLDASAVVAAITDEAGSERVWAWLRSHAGDPPFVSPWVDTEVSSALSIKVRTKAIDPQQREAAAAQWRRFRDNDLLTLAITDRHFAIAAAFADRHDLGLRAGDALHLAVAADSGCAIVTLDRTLATAAPLVGVAVTSL